MTTFLQHLGSEYASLYKCVRCHELKQMLDDRVVFRLRHDALIPRLVTSLVGVVGARQLLFALFLQTRSLCPGSDSIPITLHFVHLTLFPRLQAIYTLSASSSP